MWNIVIIASDHDLDLLHVSDHWIAVGYLMMPIILMPDRRQDTYTVTYIPTEARGQGGSGSPPRGGRGGRQLEIVRGVLFCRFFAVFCPFLAIFA